MHEPASREHHSSALIKPTIGVAPSAAGVPTCPEQIPEITLVHSTSPSIQGKPRALELCAGSASLSARLFEFGIDVSAIDTKRNRFRVKFPITDLDLVTVEAVGIISEIIIKTGVQYVHAGVPCGTASRAREIPIPGNPSAPRALRSESEPWGRTDIVFTDVEKSKLEAANAVYKSVALILKLALQTGAIVSIENPERSYLWNLNIYQDLLELGLVDTLFDQCAFGGERPKRTRWRGTAGVFASLSKCCPGESGSHKHRPWGMAISDNKQVFATSLEAVYPRNLCSAVSDCVATALHSRGFTVTFPKDNPNFGDASKFQLSRAQGAASRSTMGKRPLPLISEFDRVDYVPQGQVDSKKKRVIREHRGETANNSPALQVVGTFRSPQSFLEQAYKLEHPVDYTSGSPEKVNANIEWLCKTDPVQVCKARLIAVREISKLVADNRAEEASLHSSWSAHRQAILRDKQLLALDRLAKQIGHPDEKVVSQAGEGFRLVGLQAYSGYFEQLSVVAISSESALLEAAVHNNRRAVTSTKSSADPNLDLEAWKLVEEEISRGWISQPVYSTEEAEILWPRMVISRRFPIRQGNKIRLIDDFSESNVNLSFAHSERLSFHDIDVICAMLNSVAIINQPQARHRAWNGKLGWVGRTLDLKSAYKQWAVADDQISFNIICVWNPVLGRPAIFAQFTLPFGALSAVVNFNRLARLVWEILVQKLRLVVVNFYDDFPMIEPSTTSALAQTAAETMLRLLGWAFAEQGAKSVSFAGQFVALGVTFDISRLDEGLAAVFNKPSRVEAIQADLVQFRDAKRFGKTEKECMRGRLQFLERHVFGRLGKFLINRLCGTEGDARRPQLSDFGQACDEVINWLGRLRPRDIRPSSYLEPVLIFTDGAEGDVPGCLASCGAALFERVSGTREHFGIPIPVELVKEWKSTGSRKIIAQAELLPILLAKTVWKRFLVNRRVLVFVDNESAKSACINMFSLSVASIDILRLIAEWELDCQSWSWYSRVASFSNVADAASRLQHEVMIRDFGTKRIDCLVPISLKTAKLQGGDFIRSV